MFQSEGESLGFAGMETRAEMPRHRVQQGSDLQPAVTERRIERLCRRRVPQLNQLLPQNRRNKHKAELLPQQSEPADDGEI